MKLRPTSPNCSRRLQWSIVIVVSLCTTGVAIAQKGPQLGYAFPPAIRAGAITNVQLGGFDFTPDMQWFVHDERVQLQTSGGPGDYRLTPPPYWFGPRAGVAAMPIAREVDGQVHVDATMPAGLVHWQVANANGSSQTAVFYVSHGQEIVEARSRDLPQRLPPLPVAVSGRLSRLTEVDRYELVADADGLISIDLMARRIGAAFHGMLRVRDSIGHLLAELADTQGLDGGVTFEVKAGETYGIELHDVDFRGDRTFVYRLAVTRGPRVLYTLPAAGQRGTAREVEFVGLGVSSGRPVLESFKQVVDFPLDPALHAITHSLMTPLGMVDVTIPLSELEEQARVAPQPITAPIAITNVMPPDTDQESFLWSVEKDEHWTIDLHSRAIGGQLDVALSILDPNGKVIAEIDDLPGTTDAGLEFRAELSGTFTLIARSVGSRFGTVGELYRLLIRRCSPDFALTLPQQNLQVPLGGKTEVTVQAKRLGGFEGDIVLTAAGMPLGVTPVGVWTIPKGKNEAKVFFEAAPHAAVVAAAIEVRGVAEIAGATLTRQAIALASGNLCPRSSDDCRISVSLLAVTMTPPFDVLLIDRTRQREVHRGSTYLADIEIVRKEGFSGEIKLEMASGQSRYLCGSHGLDVVVPADAARAVYPTWMSECLGTEFTIRMSTQGVAAVADPEGNLRYLTKPTDAAITMIMEGALLKLTLGAHETDVRIGDLFEIPVSISRSANLPIATTITLDVPEEVAGLLQAEPLRLLPGQDHGTMKISTRGDHRLAGNWSLKFRALALQDDLWPVISECELQVVFTSPMEIAPNACTTAQ